MTNNLAIIFRSYDGQFSDMKQKFSSNKKCFNYNKFEYYRKDYTPPDK